MPQGGYRGDPAESPEAALRFKLCDTKQPYFFTDAEITYLLGEAGGDCLIAALMGCRKKVAHYAKCVDKSIGKVRISYSQLYKNSREMCEDLEDQVRCQGSEVFFGGLEADKACDPRNGRTVFEIGQDDNGWGFFNGSHLDHNG